jgi:hypothetical protein
MKEELIAGLREAREALREAIEGLPPEVRDGRPIVNWTVKDLVGHIAFWRGVDRRLIEAALARACPLFDFRIADQRDLDEVNAREVARRRGRTWEETWRELEREEEAFLSLVEGLSEQHFQLPVSAPWPNPGTVADCVRVEIDHQLTHARRIREWRKVQGI